MPREPNHTPGPWCVMPESDGQEIVAYGLNPWYVRQVIAEVQRGDNWIANGSLLARAPELLEQCDTYRSLCMAMGSFCLRLQGYEGELSEERQKEAMELVRRFQELERQRGRQNH